MEETKDDSKSQPGDTGRTRDEQATSSETLGDLEKTQSDAASGKSGGSSGTGSSMEGSSPSPDPAADSAGAGRADGSDTGGPM